MKRSISIAIGLILLAGLVWGVMAGRETAVASNNSFNCTNVNEIPQIECEALVAIYNSTDGGNWTINTDWLATSTPCNWFRVTCDGGNITELALFNNNLAGPLPAELGNLTKITALHLHSNHLTGNIPPELGNLTNLTRLFLLYNQLNGNIPAQLGNLTNLHDISLVSNQLSGSIPPELGNLTKVTYLNLDDNQLSGTLPSELGNMSSLTQLYVEENPLDGPIPSTFTKLNLNAFWFENTNICEPDNPSIQAWLNRVESIHSTDVICVDPSLTLNYESGAQGSYFTVTGKDFPANRTATIQVNTIIIGTIPTDADGRFTFLLTTANADEGTYFVTASVNPTATKQFVLNTADPVRPQESTGNTFGVPNGIAFNDFIYLPSILR